MALEGLQKNKQLKEIRRDYTIGLEKEGLNTGEHVALDLNITSTVLDAGIAIGHALASLIYPKKYLIWIIKGIISAVLKR